ncbi:DUF3325 domain-containing protein [Sphingomonas mollis]|uniref:DUF3325 domain-containing protein n=1 Tax=Sphingomonas mollis TaxID=2795726 RepID=A0ABS0XTE3_9SPHN|nr:DUF3325 domain-containing protein [Sphingomonas sp. BT553]MBJ6123301.1 DUF3325 domain-containing protein [Sphingomonas sp. BT553]
MTILATLMALAAFLSFGLASDRHHEPRFGRRLPAPDARRWRLAGWALLAAGFVAAIVARGWVFGPVLWTGLVMAGAAVSFLWLNLTVPPRDRRRR